jgi:predicted amidohydrolase YtcJ
VTRASLVVCGDVVLAATARGLEHAEAIGIEDGRVVSAGTRHEVLDAAAPGCRVVDLTGHAVVPGLSDSHAHLIALARARRELRLDDIERPEEMASRLRDAAAALPAGAWVRGRGWHARALARPAELVAGMGERPAYLVAHDGHSAWASPAALRLAGISEATSDPQGGRLERDAAGLTGVLRETALQLMNGIVPPLSLDETRTALDEQIGEFHALGLTGMTDAGDATDAGGHGAYAALGDTFSTVASLGSRLDGRLRLRCNLPQAAVPAGAALGLRTGAPLEGSRTISVGWAKHYADGALGSHTAALFEPYADDPDGSTGILRLDREAIAASAAVAIPAGISLAVHAIGDRAAAGVLDALEAAGPRRRGAAPHRIEHLQLLRAGDRARLAGAGLTASMQPMHAVADRDMADAAWGDRLAGAYAWRSIAAAGARLVFGSDAPIESMNPWLGIFAAVARHMPGDARGAWTADERVPFHLALAAYTSAAGEAAGRPDEGHLRPGARADVAVLDADLATLLAADERLPAVKATLTLVDGIEVHRS